ncbi:MAG: hypothetical protein ACLQOO_06310, partial [Terriglobia bacterium]
MSASFSRNPFAAIGANDDDDDAAAAAPAANDGARALDNNRYGVIDKRSENLQHCQWHQGAAGGSGWMSDFGEALPFDAKLYGGATPRSGTTVTQKNGNGLTARQST